MNSDFAQFVHEYYRSLVGLLDTIPLKSRNFVPPCISRTGFVIAVLDPSGRYAVEFLGKDRHETLTINGTEARPSSENEPGFIILEPMSRLESVVFPGTTDNSQVTWHLSGHAALYGLSFASADFIANHKPEGFHAQFVGGDVPFQVETEGGLLVVNVTNGYVVNGEPRIKFIEWLRIFGSRKFIPTSEMGIRELAITDLSSAVLKLPSAESHWKFGEFLDALKGPVDKNVLILGSYLTEDRFHEASAALERLGYAPFLLKDSPDLPIQRNLEKLFAAVMFSSFVVIIDDHASGHLAELATLLQFRFRPMIIVRTTTKPSTSFLEDGVLTNDSCRVEVLDEITSSNLTPAVRWAREWLMSQESKLNAINEWRSSRRAQ